MDSYLKYLSENSTELILYAQQHFLLVLYSVALATVFSLVLALVLHTNQLTPPSWRHTLRVGSRETSLLLASAALTIPSLALFGLLQPLLGLGVTPSIVALTLYAIYPVLRNTVAGLSSVDPAVLDAARGVGMGPVRRIFRVQLPLAWPVIISGIRVAVLIVISIAVVAAIIDGPGFGRPLQDGLARLGAVNSFNEVISGTLGCLVVAAGYEIIFAVVRLLTTPRGLRV
ncbi:MAG: ABC transporter permease [Actinomycetota bacterium]|jgi:osmoprotectant transport system permease protein|nr:ABC transporter permease [Actinomycetota bacterium]MDQ3901905.1 ABC transporter permease [Actinomycetota bacterium]